MIFNVVRYGAHLCGRSVVTGSGEPGVDALGPHARPSLGFVGTEEGRGKMMMGNILRDKEGVQDTSAE